MLYNENFLDFFEDNKKNKNIFEIQKICSNVVLDKLQNKDGGLAKIVGGILAAGGIATTGAILGPAASALVTGGITAAVGVLGSIPVVGWIILGVAVVATVVGVAMFLYSNNKEFEETSNANQQTVSDIENSNTQSIIEDGQALRDQELQKIKDEQAQHQDKIPEEYKTGDNGAVIDELQAPVISNPYLNNNSTSGNAQSSNGLTQPTVDYVATAIEQAKANDNQALGSYEDILQQILPTKGDLDNMLQENLDKIKNPFEVTEETGEEENNNETTKENIEKMKEKLDFDKEDFDAIESYSIEIGDVKSYLYVTSDIKVITDLDDYKSFGLNTFTGTKYVENGKTHYVARAYDVDGNPLDSVIESQQNAYLAFGGKSASNGYAKLTGSGNETNYCIEGYGAITFGGVEKFTFYIQGNYDDNNEPTIEISEISGQNVSDTYKGTIRTAMETMRAINNNSYEVEKGEGTTFEFELSTSTKKDTIEEDGHTYTYNKKDEVIIFKENADISDIEGVSSGFFEESNSQSKMTVEDALNMGYTMEDLIEQGYEPIEKNGEPYSKEENEESNTNFEVSLKKEVSFLDNQCMLLVDGTTIYATMGNYRDCIVVKDENGNTYTIDDAIANEICTVKELVSKIEQTFNIKTTKMGS